MGLRPHLCISTEYVNRIETRKMFGCPEPILTAFYTISYLISVCSTFAIKGRIGGISADVC